MLAPKFPIKLLSIAANDRWPLRAVSLRLSVLGRLLLGGMVLVGLWSLATIPALAHHPLGGRLPANAFEGFLSGVAHPVIGLDHFAFVLAAGLIAATKRRGILIPVAFVLASLMGTGLHLMLWNLPAPELIVSASVLAFGAILAVGDKLNLAFVLGLGALAGVFHGYAYGEAIFGAEMSPLVAYLAGFAVIQLVISLLFFAIGCAVLKKVPERPTDRPALSLRFAGFTLAGVGLAFLSSVMLG
ncbi:MAG: HupE/UreJ family protein [Cyanobacteria bacterium P01_A01_bin.114]